MLEYGKITKEQSLYTKETFTANTGNSLKNAGANLNELTPGKVFAGEVVSVDKNKVFLKLDNGQTIQAAIHGDIKLKEGQMIAFQVKSNTGRQLAIKPMFDVVINNSSVLKALENAGIPVNQKNTELVNLLMKEQMPIDKNTIMQFLRQMILNPKADMKTLVQLQRMGLPITEENIAKFESYKNHEYRLSNDIMTMASDVAEFVRESAQGQENIAKIFGEITDIVFTGNDDILESLKAEYGTSLGEGALKGAPVLYDNLRSEAVLKNNGENLTEIQKQALENIEVMAERFNGQESEINHILESMKSLNDEAEGVMKALEENIMSETAGSKNKDMVAKLFAAFEMYETAEKSMEAAKTALNSEEYVLPEESGNLQEKNAVFKEEGIKAILNENGREILAQNLQKAGGDIPLYLQVRNGSLNAEELVMIVKNMIDNQSADVMHIKELLQSEEFQKVLKSAIEEQLLLKPEDLSKESVKRYYERLDTQMRQLSELINRMGKTETSVMKNATAVRQEVEYINQLNQLYTYVQLPVKLSTQNAHSELYIMTNKKRLREKDGTFTALLHLDMEVLGSMDIYITMEKKRVSAKFYLQNEAVAKFLETHSEPMIQKLEEKGFLVTAGFEKRAEEQNIVEEFTNSEPEGSMVNKYSFDIRT